MQDAHPTRRPSHRFEAHTAEVRVRLEADTLPQLFEEAGRALADLMMKPPEERLDASGEPLPPLAREPSQRVCVQASDREALLVEWLNELIYWSETRGCVYDELRVESVLEQELCATIRGVRVEELRTAVKAATWHELSIAQDEHGFHASLVLDV